MKMTTTTAATTVTTTAGVEAVIGGVGSGIEVSGYGYVDGDGDGDGDGGGTKTKSNSCPSPTMTVILASRLISNLMLKVVDTDLVDLEELRLVLTVCVESPTKLLQNISPPFINDPI